MIVDLKLYEVNRPIVIRWCERNSAVDKVYAASLLSNMTFCPVIAMAYIIGEHYGWPEEIVECIKRLIKFYRYDTILNKPPGSPV